MCEIESCIDENAKKPEVTDTQRRAFLAGTAALPLAVILAYPDLSKAAASKTKSIVIDEATGTMGALAMPKGNGKHPALLLIHEWWGLNDNIKTVAAEYAELGYLTFAIDLHGGKVAKTPDEARALTGAIEPEKATKKLTKAIDYLRNHARSTGKIGTNGWCFGGGWSLNASIATPVDATVIYYGRVTREASDLKKLNGPLMGHFGTLDRFINEKMISGFEAELKKAGKDKDATIHWYEANHGFANPTSAIYDKEDAMLAWDRTLKFYQKHLG